MIIFEIATTWPNSVNADASAGMERTKFSCGIPCFIQEDLISHITPQ